MLYEVEHRSEALGEPRSAFGLLPEEGAHWEDVGRTGEWNERSWAGSIARERRCLSVVLSPRAVSAIEVQHSE